MKCPNCNQVILDNKIYCTNCGKKIRNSKSNNMNPKKGFLIMMVVMILLGVGTIYMIANFGAEEELENIISNSNDSIDDFYDSYLIKNVVFTDKSSKEYENIKDDLVGFEMELTKDKFKIGLFQILWANIKDPKIIKIANTDKYKKDLDLNEEKSFGIRIEGTNTENDSQYLLKFDMINIGDKLFLFYKDIYFELEESTLGYKSTKTYYKVNLLKENYSSKINSETKKINDKTKKDIESGALEIYIKNYEEYTNNDVIHLVIRLNSGFVNSGMYTNVETLTFNRNTGDVYNLKTYIEHIGKNYDDIISKYEINKEKVYNSSVDLINEKFETSPNLMYYVKENKIYIACGRDQWGTLFTEVEL